MSDPFFDESQRPTSTVDFEYPPEPDEQAALISEVRRESLRIVRRYLENEYAWAAQGRTKQTRLLRLALLRDENQDDDELARRFNLSRQAVSKQRQILLKLRSRLLVKG
jgi:hypothetical protein